MARPALVTLGLAVALLVWNNLVHATWFAGVLYVPLNLLAAGTLVLAARRAGLSRGELGLGRDRLPSGVRWGLLAAGIVAVALLVALVVPALRPLLEDGRYEGIGAAGWAYLALVRIPLGTALWEELAFRGVLYGSWARWRGPRAAAVGSSVVFGLWHIRPTMGLATANGADAPFEVAAVVAGGVLITVVAGLLFVWLRRVSGSIAAPIIAHIATNSLALSAAAMAGDVL